MTTWLVATTHVAYGVRNEIFASAAPADSSIAIAGIKPVKLDRPIAVCGLQGCPASDDWVDLVSELRKLLTLSPQTSDSDDKYGVL
jgi:hypothetical protein